MIFVAAQGVLTTTVVNTSPVDDTDKLIRHLYVEQELSLGTVSKNVGHSKYQVEKRLTRMGVKIRSPEEGVRIREERKKERVKQILRTIPQDIPVEQQVRLMHKASLSRTIISQHSGLSTHYVHKIINNINGYIPADDDRQRCKHCTIILAECDDIVREHERDGYCGYCVSEGIPERVLAKEDTWTPNRSLNHNR